jgi:hypothetical protein
MRGADVSNDGTNAPSRLTQNRFGDTNLHFGHPLAPDPAILIVLLAFDGPALQRPKAHHDLSDSLVAL